MEDEGDINYYQVYVDGLSNLVLALVFVMIVLVFAFAITATKVGSKVASLLQEVAAQKTQMATAAPPQPDLQASLSAQLKPPVPQGEEAAQHAPSQEGISIIKKKDRISVVYPHAADSLNEKSIAEFVKAAQTLKPADGKFKVTIISHIGSETYSYARRLAYNRSLELRAIIISQVISDTIPVENRIVSDAHKDKGQVDVIFDPQ